MEEGILDIERILLDKLHFDPQNPRLPKELQGSTDETAVIAHMLRDENLTELMESIAQMGYSASEPLLVVKSAPDSYIVVEGNRRLAALKLIASPELAAVRRSSVNEIVSAARHHPKEIPCICYDSRDDILDYLGYRHITGVKSWGALEKARYLKQLYDRYISEVGASDICPFLAKMIGSRRDYVAKLLATYTLYERANDNAYFGVDVQEKDIDFSLLSTAVGYENIHQFIGMKSSGDIECEDVVDDNFKFLFECLYDPKKKIQESRELRKLNDVIGSPKALEQYRTGSTLEIAGYYTAEPFETFKQFIRDAYVALENAKKGVEQVTINSDELTELKQKLEEIKRMSTAIVGSLMALHEEDADN